MVISKSTASLAAMLCCAVLAATPAAVAQSTAEAPAGEAGATNPAFDAALGNAIPLTPEMILELRKRFEAVERARAIVGGGTAPAVPVQRSINASLGPGGATSIIQTVDGYPSAIAFVDATGQPWPIAWDTTGNAAAGPGPAVNATGFEVNVPTKGSNVLQITPRSAFPRGGLLVNLESAPAPLTFMMIAGKGRYDARVDVRVADRGPNAKAQIITRPNTPETGASHLMAMLDGVPPAEAVPLSVSGVSPDDVRAWRLGDRLYLRTAYTLLSPEWSASLNGEAGMVIYSLPSTPVVLLSAQGRSIAAHLAE